METIKKGSIFIINQFLVPKVSEDAFMDFLIQHMKLISLQTGNTETRFFKAKGEEDYSIYTSLVGWKNEEAFKHAGIEIESIAKEKGIDIRAFQEKHKIKVINRIFSEVPVL